MNHFAQLYSRSNAAIEANLITVEVNVSAGLPSFSIVGLPDATVKESKDRVRAALVNTGFEFPAKRITVNLAPADVPKDGARFDLAIAIGILLAAQQFESHSIEAHELIGELSLNGQLREVPAVLPTAKACKDDNRSLILPEQNAAEASLIKGASNFPANSLLDVVRHLTGAQLITEAEHQPPTHHQSHTKDIADVIGQFHAKFALEVAAAGAHHMLMIGPPGTGKTMLASRLPSIMPRMTEEEAIDTAAIHSISQQGLNIDTWLQRPFREPHHTSSAVALVGGSSKVLPGEVSLAHNGILFLDELTEFDRKIIDALREPLETKEISLSRAARQAKYPANFQLVAAMNPCHRPNNQCDMATQCDCHPEQRQRYLDKISGPFMDRMDIKIHVPRPDLSSMGAHNSNMPKNEKSIVVKQRVHAARQLQMQRQGLLNGQLSSQQMTRFCTLDEPSTQALDQLSEKRHISLRAQHKIIKLARTIADLNEHTHISMADLLKAVSLQAF